MDNIYTHIIIAPLSSSVQEERYLLIHNGRYFEASLPVVELLRTLQEYPTEEEGISAYICEKKGKYTVEEVREVISQVMAPLFVVKKEKRTFLYEKELLSASAIDKLSDRFSFLFHRICIIVVLLLALGLDIHFFCSAQLSFVFNNTVDVYTVAGLFLFMIASSFFHELGHASACKYLGIRHGGIGFGLYLNFPVLYTNVTEVWKLSRRKRCIVNIAGVYFQCFALIGLLIGVLLTNNDILRYLVLIMNLGFIMTLNPFFKFDGYWMASDLLGVPNLRTRSKELASYLYQRMCQKWTADIPYLLQIRPIEKYCLLAYSILVNLFMGYYFVYIIPRFLCRFIQSFPDEVERLILYLSNNITPPFALLRNIGMQLLFLVLIGMMLFKLVQPLVAKYGKRK